MASPYENELKRIENDARLARESARRDAFYAQQEREAKDRSFAAAAAQEQKRHADFMRDFYSAPQQRPTYDFSARSVDTTTRGGAGAGYGGRSSSGSAFAGFVVFVAVIVFLAGGKSGDSGASLRNSIEKVFAPEYTPAPVNATFTTANFLKRLEAKGCKKSTQYYAVCTGALEELRSGKYTVLNCQHLGGIKRYAWSPEAPPNVNRYQEFDRETIYGVDRGGAKDCGSLRDSFR